MKREYFCLCFVCGSESSDCGHREHELVLWWNRSTRSGARVAFFEAETALPAIEPQYWQRGYQKRLPFRAVADNQRIQ